MVVPFISKIATLPLLYQTISLLPSPLKSPVPTIDQAVGTCPTNDVARFKILVPFISQIATLPLVSCHRTSLMPSPLKSWVAVFRLAQSLVTVMAEPADGMPLATT